MFGTVGALSLGFITLVGAIDFAEWRFFSLAGSHPASTGHRPLVVRMIVEDG